MPLDRIIEIAILLGVLPTLLQLFTVASAVRAARWIRATLALVAAAYAALIVGIAIAAPAWLGPLAISTGAGLAYACWRARPSHGSGRGLPPGSLGLRSSLQALTDYHFYEKQATRHGPIFKTSQYYRPVVCVVGLSRIRELLHRHRDQLAPAPLSINRGVAGGLLRYMAPDQHRAYRKVFQSCLTPQTVRECEPFMVDRARLALSAMAADCTARSTAGVRPFEYIDAMTFSVCARVFFGFHPDDESVPGLMKLYAIIEHRRLWRHAANRRALTTIGQIVKAQAERLGRHPQAMPSCFLAEAIRHDAAIACDPTFIANLVYVLHVARCDLDGLLGWLVKMLCDHPEWGVRVRNELGQPGHDADSSTLADRFVTETLRLHQSEYLYRTTSDRIELEGFVVPRGWLLRACIRESHASDQVFEKPEGFNPDRFLDRAYPQDEYQPFGAYERACLGVPLTKALARILVEQLVEGFEWAVVQDGPLELGLHHHEHWKPSSRLSIRLVTRAPRPQARPSHPSAR